MPRIKGKPFEIDRLAPFEDDFFKSELIVTSIINLVESLEESLVLGLNAPWGHGKTTLVSRLEACVKKDHSTNIGFIRYDAFKNDYFSDVFVSITSSITAFLSDCQESATGTKKSSIETAKNEFIKQGTRVVKSVLKNAAIRGIKHASAGFVDLPGIADDVENAIGETLADSASEFVDGSLSSLEVFIGERLEKASSDQQLIEDFSKQLKIAITETGRSRLIFVVDELDRCNPAFSVEVLEKVKHFFSCENVLFILIYNKRQLEKSIVHIYGVDTPEVYLQRFIDIESDVSIKNNGYQNKENFENFVKKVLGQHDFVPPWSGVVEQVINDSFVLYGKRVSLRSVERICTQVAAYSLIQTGGKNFIYDKHLIAILCFLKICNPGAYSAMLQRAKVIENYESDRVSECLPLDKLAMDLRELFVMMKKSSSIYEHMYTHFLYHLYVDDPDSEARPFPTQLGAMVSRGAYFNKCFNLISVMTIG